ncbi:dihydroxyacetone kinase subunit L [Lacrimispora indolis]|uniref:dihydroxyacetone kinase subunit L n=1 Tax=Lacrimispora indolis TaxID=69825 RepID=UPI00045EBFDB|nr:dihydroxyacetone kinase subunit L [Lacrimispora indolis]MBE7721847.1 dihydroxyacetone kinase subunit L [Lacrimispora celerecrescens]
MDAQGLARAIGRISRKIEENKDYLVKLDQQNGDGDLGISMNDGFKAVCMIMELSEEKDLGKLLMKAGNAFNEAAPSSLGTILSFGFMGMARSLKGTMDATPRQIADALHAGVDKIMEKAGSRPGERTILDSLYPAVETLGKKLEEENGDLYKALKEAARIAAVGAEATKQMKPVHGRAAYYGEKNLGYLDGGAVVGRLIFEALCGD